MEPKRSTRHYKNNNASIEEEMIAREYAKALLCDSSLIKEDGRVPCAVVFGLSDSCERKKLLKHPLIFYSSESYEKYILKYKCPVLAVYDKSHDLY